MCAHKKERKNCYMRTSGILMHISSLPSSGGIGSLGPEAYAFDLGAADVLHRVGDGEPSVGRAVDQGPTPALTISPESNAPLLRTPSAKRDVSATDDAQLGISPTSAAKRLPKTGRFSTTL